ncbi:MAG: hypothetical protein ACMXX6_01895, partial [Candidatus Woesearchaeota archaeon]
MTKKLTKFLISILSAIIISGYISLQRGDVYGFSGIIYFFMLALLLLPFAMTSEILFRNLIKDKNNYVKVIMWLFLFALSLMVLFIVSLVFFSLF